MHYLFEPDSFVPLAQVHTEAVRGVKVPNWNQYRPYDSDLDPLRKPAPEPSEPTAVYYHHTDHLGTPQALTDEQGALALEMDYQAWGQAREIIADAASKAGIRNPCRFQGQYQDEESGLHYNRHRYYDPEIGRFISRDPIGLMGGLNIHNYTPNPVSWVDPLGLAARKPQCPVRAKAIYAEKLAEIREATATHDYTNRPNANLTVPGGVSGAIEHTKRTGELVGGSDHVQKGMQIRNTLKITLKQVDNAYDLCQEQKKELHRLADPYVAKLDHALSMPGFKKS
ncbi:RHS repeat domain-containing protein [Chromobacterium sp.]|uniref:RHS repeat domain-containing protein n=1 Tax=Chromobacterium sp. TaxID=306190 RepID=UPI0035B49376